MDDRARPETGRNIKTIENKADTITYQTIQLLHRLSSRRSTDGDHQLITRMDTSST